MKRKNESLPHSNDAERSILGAVLIDDKQFARARGLLSGPQAFYSSRHRKIFDAFGRLSEAGSALDLVTLKDDLVRAGTLEDCGGPAYLAGLIDGVPRSSNVEHYARIVQEKARRRNMIRLAGGITEAASNGATPVELDELIEGLTNSLRPAGGAEKTGVCMIGTQVGKTKIVLPKPLVAGLINVGDRGIIFGDTQSGKSLWALALGVHLAGGFRFAGSWDTGTPQRVAMLFFEDRLTPGGGYPPRILWRYRSIIAGLRAQYKDTAREEDVEVAIKKAEANILIWCGTDQDEGLAAARDHGAKLTVIDSWLNVCTPGEDEYRREVIQADYDRIHTALGNEAFLVIDHTRKGQADGSHGDANSLFGSVRKLGVCDVVIKLIVEEASNGDVGVCLKPVKGRDGLDLPAGGRVLAWTGMPAGERIPLDEVTELVLRHEKDKATAPKLGERAAKRKEADQAKLANFIRGVNGRSLPINECAEYADRDRKTIRRWVEADPSSPFVYNVDGEVTLRK